MKSPILQAAFLLPSRDGIAIFHAKDVRFEDDFNGRNILCISKDIDLKKKYDVEFGRVGNLSTFMQVTMISVL